MEKKRDVMNIHKASNAPFDLTITIDRVLPPIHNDTPIEALSALYDRDAQSIFENLRDVLPQATMNRLIIKMLEQQAGHMRLAYIRDGA